MEQTIKTETLAVTEIRPQESKQDRNAKKKKTLIIITYVIALLCLLAGLLVPPLFNFREYANLVKEQAETIDITNYMMIKHIPDMFNDLYSFFAKSTLIPEGTLLNWFPISGEVATYFKFDSLIGLLYAVMCVIGLFMLIPVCAGKKTKNTSANAALVVEILVIIFVAAYICFHTYGFILENKLGEGWDNYNFFIAIGGALLMAMIQSIAAKGSIGVSKTVGVILTALMVICLLDVTMFLKALEGPFTSFSQLIHSGETLGFVTGEGVQYLSNLGIGGITVLLLLIMGGGEAAAEIFRGGAMTSALYALVIIIAILTIINLLSDIIGLGTGKKFNSKGQAALNTASNTYALVRYILTFLVTAVVIVLTFFTENVTAGLYLYAFEVFMLIQLINAIGRTAAAGKRYKKYEAEKDHVEATIEINDPTYAEQAVASAAPAADEQQAYSYQPNMFGENPYTETATAANGNDYNNNAQPNYATQNGQQMSFDEAPDNFGYTQQNNYGQPYAQQTYNGLTDPFMDTLTDSEKQEFSDVFLMKTKGFVRGVPDYQINAMNEDFFPAVFVHINRYRTICSDGLLGKMYKQLGKVI